MDGLLDLNALAGQVAAAVIFLIPGLNTTWLLDRLIGRAGPPGVERLLKAISWSVLIYLALVWWLAPFNERLRTTPFPSDEVFWLGATTFVAVPALFAITAAGLRRWEFLQRGVRKVTGIHPAPTAWDYAFPGFVGFVLVRLRDGRFIGGEFWDASFASSYPEPQDLYLERLWRLSEEGEFLEPLARTRGALVRRDEIESVQFFGEEAIDGKEERAG